MAADVTKQMERAKRFLEKNRLEDAVAAYLAVLEESPQHQEASQALGDLYARLDQPERAAVYYAHLFDLLTDPKEESKALAIYNRFLRASSVQQPPERIARYAFLQQKQNHGDEAMGQYSKAAELFAAAGRPEDALFCWERIAQIDPGGMAHQMRLAEAAAELGKNALAARAFLRAGQLASASGAPNDALRLLARAHKLAPGERGAALLYGEAILRAGDAQSAVTLLEPFAVVETSGPLLDTFADALVRSGQLDQAREVLQRLPGEKNEGITRLFELAGAYSEAGKDTQCVELLKALKQRMFADKKQDEFATRLEGVVSKHTRSKILLEFAGTLYNELNRESQYFEVLIKLYDLYFEEKNFPKAGESLERLVDIDSYDYRNQERLERLSGHVDDLFLKRISARLASSVTLSTQPSTRPQPTSAHKVLTTGETVTEEGKKLQALEDLIVQTEIFLQYALQAKALERLQKIASMFPGEEKRNPRLLNLYQTANWWPAGAARTETAEPAAGGATQVTASPVGEVQTAGATSKTGIYTAETLRDLSKISEINQKIFRQQTPRAMLNTAVSEVGSYLHATRALAVIGTPGRPPELAAEYCAANVRPAPGAQVVFLLAHMEKAKPDDLGGLVVDAVPGSILSELNLRTALAVIITDKETQAPAGMLILGHADAHKWKPNETYFLQAIGDQMLMNVSHTRLRSLVRRMGVSDERTGLLSRSSYQSCLLNEAERAKTQGTPLALAILQIDRGAEILRQQGESPLERFLEQLARSLQPIVRQNDVAVKYTSWSLAFVLPDTTLAGAQNLADKLKRAASGVRPPWDSTQITLSAGIVEAVAKSEYDSEDIVTDLINRAEFSMEEARKRGGDTIVSFEIPKS